MIIEVNRMVSMKKADLQETVRMMTFMIGPQRAEELGLQIEVTDTPILGIPPWGGGKRTKYINIYYHVGGKDGYDDAQILEVVRSQSDNYNSVKYFYINKFGINEQIPMKTPSVIEQEKEDNKTHKVSRRTLTPDQFSMEWKNGALIPFICELCGETMKGCICLSCPDCGEQSGPLYDIPMTLTEDTTCEGVTEKGAFSCWTCPKCENKFNKDTLWERLAIQHWQDNKTGGEYQCPTHDINLEYRVNPQGNLKMEMYCKECEYVLMDIGTTYPLIFSRYKEYEAEMERRDKEADEEQRKQQEVMEREEKVREMEAKVEEERE